MQLAIPNKGALSEDTVALFKEAGYRCTRTGRELIVSDAANGIDFIFLRPRDIAIYIGNGIIELGVTGRDLAIDSASGVAELLPLNFGRSNFRYAVPKESTLMPKDFHGLRIATSYPELLRLDLARHGVEAKIVRLDGAVEISIQLGVADAIADVVESGATLKEAGLKVVGDSLLESEAVLIGRNPETVDRPEVQRLIGRLRGILVARTYAMIEYDIPKDMLEEACTITPGIEAPTVAPLANDKWVAVKSMILRKDANSIMDRLHDMGARGVIVTDIRSCRL